MAAKPSDSIAAGIIYVIAIGFAIYYLWQCHKIERNLKTESREKKEK
jgi:hypothetical protein